MSEFLMALYMVCAIVSVYTIGSFIFLMLETMADHDPMFPPGAHEHLTCRRAADRIRMPHIVRRGIRKAVRGVVFGPGWAVVHIAGLVYKG